MFFVDNSLGRWILSRAAGGSKAAILTLFLLTPSFTSGQEPAQPTISPVSSTSTQTNTPGKQAAGNPATNLKDSLKQLSSLYQQDVERLTARHKQSQDLFNDGLIARVELEASAKAVADAQAKLDQVLKQIADADKSLAVVVPELALLENGESHGWWTTGNIRIDNQVKLNAGLYGVDPYLVFCLMSQESSFTSTALSPKGAQGLMQLMPATAARYGVTNPYDVAQNIKAGTHYLKDLLDMFEGRIDLALAAYNAGENAVIKYGYQIPPFAETQAYVRLISKRYSKKPSRPASIKVSS